MTRAPKQRLDQLVLDQGMADSQSKAQALIMSGQIYLNGNPVTKVGQQVPADALLELRSNQPTYVSRGGLKLAHALNHFKIDPQGLHCLDVGASTGGFTDCLLQHGVCSVFSIDVGRGQLDAKIRHHPLVTWKESFHANALRIEILPEPVDMACVDVSFISLKKILPHVIPCIKPGGKLLALIKPQFEAERKDVGKGGVVRNEEERQAIIMRLTEWTKERFQFQRIATVDSAILGPKGNQEAFLYGET